MPPPPQYFAKNAMLNKTGYDTFETVLNTGNIALNPDEFEALANHEEALVLDVRNEHDFVKSHIPNSIFIGLNGSFAPWVGALITDLKQPIILVVPEGKAKEAVTRLSRVGYDNTLGYLDGGIKAWIASGKDIESIKSISAEEFSKKNIENLHVLDVRKDGEYKSTHLENAQHFALDFINENMSDINNKNEYHLYCAGGYRSVIASSILKARGFSDLINIEGGFGAIKKTDLTVSEYVCPSTL
jgi:rhodanese-related sulfurtransferase